MVDRVDSTIGRLGPVGDSAAMAANILALWSGDLEAMRQGAVAQARNFGWDKSMECLFGEIYPLALRRAADRASRASGALAPAFAKA